MAPRGVQIWQTAALFSILLVSWGKDALSGPFPPSRCTYFFAPVTIISLKSFLSPRKSISFNLPIAERPEHSSKAPLTQPEVPDGV